MGISNGDTLKKFIKAKWFDQIASGDKIVEYREVKPFWTSRLYDKDGKKKPYMYIEFINGMKPDSKRMTTEYLGFNKRGDQYQIKIGKILKSKNFRK
jgi:hypothetical protein